MNESNNLELDLVFISDNKALTMIYLLETFVFIATMKNLFPRVFQLAWLKRFVRGKNTALSIDLG